jgi:superfamily II DNA or RNA helicase
MSFEHYQIAKESRPFQIDTARRVVEQIAKGYKRILVKSPTGTGKTYISRLIASSAELKKLLGVAHDEKFRVLFLSHKHRLNRQAEAEYRNDENIELITHSALSKLPEAIIQQGFDFTMIDEAHHEATLSIQLLLDALKDKPIIGFTADDERHDGYLLKFEKIIEAITAKRACELGYIEKAGINSIIDMGKENKVDLATDLVFHYHKEMDRTMVFFKTNEEVRQFYYRIKDHFPTAILHEHSNEIDVDNALLKLGRGEIKFLINCRKVGEGVDVKNISDVLLARQFLSKPEKKQYIGRAIRNDCSCQVWEFINPLKNNVTAKEVVGMTRYERLIYQQNKQWFAINVA